MSNDSPGARYSARLLPTGMERWGIFKSDTTKNTSLALYLISSPVVAALTIQAPAPWRVERVAAWRTTDQRTTEISVPDAIARHGSGQIKIRAEGARCLLDLDVSVTFETNVGIGPTEILRAHGVALENVTPPCQ